MSADARSTGTNSPAVAPSEQRAVEVGAPARYPWMHSMPIGRLPTLPSADLAMLPTSRARKLFRLLALCGALLAPGASARAQDPAPKPQEPPPEARPGDAPPAQDAPATTPRPRRRPWTNPEEQKPADPKPADPAATPQEPAPASNAPGASPPGSNVPGSDVPGSDHVGAQDARTPLSPTRGDDQRGEEKKPAAEPTTLDGRVPDAQAWSEMLARDARVAFTQRSGADARSLLALEKAPVDRRAAALLALGASGAVGERLMLESRAKRASGLERRAAVLALGELSSSSEALLTSFLSEPEVGECALLALLRSGRPAARRRVEEIANDPAHTLHAPARELLVFDVDRAASAPTSAAAILLELRWIGAKSFGLVDGQSWHALQTARWIADPTFVRDVVLRGTRRLYRPGVKDHLLELLLHGEGIERVVAAVRTMPLEVQDLVRNELWSPSDADWAAILDAIEDKSLETVCINLLERAAAFDRWHYKATILLARSGKVDVARFIDADLARLPVEDRVDACDAMATSRDTGWRTRLEELEHSHEPRVRLAALVARMRLGSRAAEERVSTALNDPADEDHTPLVEVLLRSAHDPLAATMLEDFLVTGPEDESLALALELCRRGRLAARGRVRDALAAEPRPLGDQALALIGALARRPGPEDLSLLRTLFPLEERREVNVEIASALLQLGDPGILPVLRAGMWKGDLDLSLLAAAVLAEVGGGVRALRDELRVPPVDASSNDLRRVGFAIGEWGGLREVEELARELRYAAGHPALQGAYLGLLTTRTQ